MSSRKRNPTSPKGLHSKGRLAGLKSSDRAVLEYLRELAEAVGDGTCIASIPNIAEASGVSERQVQISTRRLIDAGLLSRMGYDFSNPDLTKRGTIYKVAPSNGKQQEGAKDEGKRSVRFLLFWSED